MAQIKEKNFKIYNSPYIVDELINKGGMNSCIYLVHEQSNPKSKLIAKIISIADNQTIDNFQNEFRNEIITSLRVSDRPNLVHTYECFSSPDKKEIIIIQDYVQGISLKKFINKKGIFNALSALNIFKQILIGVKSLHKFEHQIIHCDLKPENIVLSYDLSKVTIIDFGISAVLNTSNTLDYLASNNSKGTLCFLSPDFLANSSRPTVQFDFFSLGAILYFMLAGEVPFKEAKEVEDEKERNTATLSKPLKFDIPNISSTLPIPVSLENMIFRCLASQPKDLKYRYKDIDEIINDTDRIIKEISCHEHSNEKLLKPAENRTYETPDILNANAIKSKTTKWYQQWWFAGVLFGLSIAVIMIAIILFKIID